MVWSRFATALTHFPRATLGIVALLTGLAGVGLLMLEFDDRPNNAFRSDDNSYLRLQQYQRNFGSDDNNCLLILSSRDNFVPDDALLAIDALAHELRSLEHVDSVWSLFDVPLHRGTTRLGGIELPRLQPLSGEDLETLDAEELRERLTTHPVIGSQLVSDDGRSLLVLIHLGNDLDAISSLTPVVRRIEAAAEVVASTHELTYHLAGIPPLRIEIFNAIQRENTVFLTLGASLAVLFAWLLFRHVRLVILVGTGPLLATAWTLGAMGLVGHKLNIINVVLPTLVIVIGLTNSIHLVTSIQRRLGQGHTPSDSAYEAVTHLGGSCLLAGVTTAIGFGSLVISSIESIRNFGLVSSSGAVFAFLANILFVPSAASLLLRPSDGAFRSRFPGLVDAGLVRLDNRVADNRRLLTILAIGLTAVLMATVPRLRPDTWLREASPPHWSSHRAILTADEKFGGSASANVVVSWNDNLSLSSPEVIATLRAIEERLNTQPEFHRPFSVLNLVRTVTGEQTTAGEQTGTANDARTRGLLNLLPSDDANIRRLVNFQQQRTQIVFRLQDLGASVYEPLFDRLDDDLLEIADRHAGVTVELTGTTVVISRSVNRMIRDLRSSLALAGGTIFIVITLFFRSVRWGLLSLIPNAFPLLMASGLLVVLDKPLQLSSVMVFSICLGIAVDDTIHLLNRIRLTLAETDDVNEAMLESLRRVGPALINSTIVLTAGFGSLLLSRMPPTQSFAWLSCTAILTALFADLVFLPAMLRVWSPPSTDETSQRLDTAVIADEHQGGETDE